MMPQSRSRDILHLPFDVCTALQLVCNRLKQLQRLHSVIYLESQVLWGPGPQSGPGPAAVATEKPATMLSASSISVFLILAALESEAMFPNTISGSEQLEAYITFSCESERPCHHRADVRKIYMQTTPGHQDYRLDLGPDPFVTVSVRCSWLSSWTDALCALL